MTLIVIKALVGIVVVLGLIYVSENLSPRIAGIIGGTPIGATAVVLFFYGIEHGIGYVQEAIPWTIGGLGIELGGFYVAYFLGSRIFKSSRHTLVHVAASLVCSFAVLLVMGSLLALNTLTIGSALSIFFIGYFIGNSVAQLIPPHEPMEKRTLTITLHIIRIAFVVALILLITSAPLVLSHRWSGILASFPATIFPLLLILQLTYKNAMFPTIIKNISWSTSTLVVYILMVYLLYPVLGVYGGTIASFMISLSYFLVMRESIIVFTNFMRHGLSR